MMTGNTATRATAGTADAILEDGSGIVRLAPAWVPRVFCTPGRRIRLHPDDYFAFGRGRGGIDERWLASTVCADNGPQTTQTEGISHVVGPDKSLVRFDEFVAHHGADLLGARIWSESAGWPVFAKFFDNEQPLPFHVHLTDDRAALVGKVGKPEAYYYSPHMNNHLGAQPVSFLGLRPGTSREDLARHLAGFAEGGDNRITALSVGYRPKLGTGWDVPAGVLHAPGSVCTYEPQAASDVLCMCESWSNNREVPAELMWKDVAPARRGDYAAILDLIEWDINVDPNFAARRFMAPIPTERSDAEGGQAFVERWVVYRSRRFSAKELLVRPGQSVVMTDAAAYGLVVVQGRGTIGRHDAAAATVVRFGELTEDEFFVSDATARSGVRIVNQSDCNSLVMLKHFGPGNPDLQVRD